LPRAALARDRSQDKPLFNEKFQIRGQIIWRKQHFVISRGAYHWQHEPCWYAVRKGKTSHWRGDLSMANC